MSWPSQYIYVIERYDDDKRQWMHLKLGHTASSMQDELAKYKMAQPHYTFRLLKAVHYDGGWGLVQRPIEVLLFLD